MKKNEIVVGKTYRGKSGRCRTVTGEKIEPSYSIQIDRDTIQYVDAKVGATARMKSMTRMSFAAWAVSEAPR